MKACLQRFFWIWIVDTLGWIGCYLPLIVLWMTAWATISGVRILEPMPEFGISMEDPAGSGYLVTIEP